MAIGTAAANALAGKARPVTIRLTRAARHAIDRARRLSVRLTLTAVDAAGRRAPTTKTVELRRSRGPYRSPGG